MMSPQWEPMWPDGDDLWHDDDDDDGQTFVCWVCGEVRDVRDELIDITSARVCVECAA